MDTIPVKLTKVQYAVSSRQRRPSAPVGREVDALVLWLVGGQHDDNDYGESIAHQ
jgi:hypothetical protein